MNQVRGGRIRQGFVRPVQTASATATGFLSRRYWRMLAKSAAVECSACIFGMPFSATRLPQERPEEIVFKSPCVVVLARVIRTSLP